MVVDDNLEPSLGTLPGEAVITKKLYEAPWSLSQSIHQMGSSPMVDIDLLPHRGLSILLGAGRDPLRFLVGFRSLFRRLRRPKIRFSESWEAL